MSSLLESSMSVSHVVTLGSIWKFWISKSISSNFTGHPLLTRIYKSAGLKVVWYA